MPERPLKFAPINHLDSGDDAIQAMERTLQDKVEIMRLRKRAREVLGLEPPTVQS